MKHEILVGDVLAGLRAMPDASVQCVVTSPPYSRAVEAGGEAWGLRDYGVEGQIGLEPTPEEYVERMVGVFREVRRVLRDDGVIWVNLGDSYSTHAAGVVEDPMAKSTLAGVRTQVVANRSSRAMEVYQKCKSLPEKNLVGIPWRVAFALQQPYYVGKIRSEKDRIWLAAMVEAEGCLFIHKRKAGQNNGQGYKRKSDTYGAGLEVASTDRAIVERCKDITGMGSICHQSPSQNGRREQTIYRWNLRSNACRDIILELYPYFVAKKQEARLLLFCPPSGSDAEKAHESLKAIYQGGPATIDFPEPSKELAALWEPGWYLRSDVIWSKCNPMPESVTDRPTKSHEYVFLFAKSKKYYYDADAVREEHESLKDLQRRKTHDNKGDYGGVRKDLGRSRTEYYNPAGRNRRTVWEIPTQPTPEAHFATFPEALVEPCIKAGTSERGACPECGAPWRRVTERGENTGKNGRYDASETTLRNDAAKHSGRIGETPVHTVGRQPSCTCGCEETVPCVVLDPFGGSGTVTKVARDLGRSSVLIELNPEYVAIMKKKLRVGEQLDTGVCEYVVREVRA